MQGITGCNSFVAIVDDGKTLQCVNNVMYHLGNKSIYSTATCVDKL